MPEIDIHGLILLVGPMHCGTGLGSATVDRLVQRNTRGAAVIPGSQLRGLVRASCESLALGLGLPSGRGPHEARPLGLEPQGVSSSPVDRLFGPTRWPSLLSFSDAVSTESEADRSDVRQRVALDRALRTAEPGHLFTTEVVTEGELSFRVRGEHMVLAQVDEAAPPFDYALLVGGLLAVERVGGSRSAGLGQCRIQVTSVVWEGKPLTVEDLVSQLEESILHDDMVDELRRKVAA